MMNEALIRAALDAAFLAITDPESPSANTQATVANALASLAATLSTDPMPERSSAAVLGSPRRRVTVDVFTQWRDELETMKVVADSRANDRARSPEAPRSESQPEPPVERPVRLSGKERAAARRAQRP